MDFNSHRGVPDDTYKYLGVALDQAPASIDVIVFNFKYTGHVDPMTLTKTNGIIINRNEININGIDIKNMKFLSTVVVNDLDPTIDFGYTAGVKMQVMNYVDGVSGVGIESDSLSTRVYSGGRKIIDSSLGSFGFKITRSGTMNISARTYNNGYNEIGGFPVLKPGEIMFLNYSMNGYDSHFGYMKGGGGFVRSYNSQASTPLTTAISIATLYVEYVENTQIVLYRNEVYRSGNRYIDNTRAIYFIAGVHGTTTLVNRMSGAASNFQFPSFSIGYVIIK